MARVAFLYRALQKVPLPPSTMNIALYSLNYCAAARALRFNLATILARTRMRLEQHWRRMPR